MVRYPVRSTTKGSWISEQPEATITVIHKEKRSIRDIARLFGIPRSTIQKRIKTNNTSFASMGRHTVMCSFKEEKKSAGDDWLQKALKRNQQISLRKPEAISINRVTAFNKEEPAQLHNMSSEQQDASDNVMDSTINQPKETRLNVTFEDILPLPQVAGPCTFGKVIRRRSKKQYSQIITATLDKKDKENRKTVKQQTITKSYKREIFAEDDDNQQKFKQRKS
ncbi:hypothetical protein ILUMI_26830 [Ignelater luminosus]|uniref:HTH psq-type domain-containing protein n=1 Tax=Ignelater luminosus TaxID=2038154 RepID=A0A8K0C5A0_IGNLU|nr:hypothetical protein ILUMI_26830 [Ignelater luminosus]